jgi:hypothetical protein
MKRERLLSSIQKYFSLFFAGDKGIETDAAGKFKNPFFVMEF